MGKAIQQKKKYICMGNLVVRYFGTELFESYYSYLSMKLMETCHTYMYIPTPCSGNVTFLLLLYLQLKNIDSIFGFHDCHFFL